MRWVGAITGLALGAAAVAAEPVDWDVVEAHVGAVETGDASCTDTTAHATRDAVAAVFAELEAPLTNHGEDAEIFAERIRAAVLVRRAAGAGSTHARTLEQCGDAEASFVAWQLAAMATSMERTALDTLDAAADALGADPARGLCGLLPSPVAQQRPQVCPGDAASDG